MATIKYSRQRESIKNFLMDRTDHPTAETIYRCLRVSQPHLSLGTVYRNLSLLCELGEIRKISTGIDADHFDGDISIHHHFICRSCHQVSDLRDDRLNALADTAIAHSDYQIDGYSFHFYGICDNCQKTMASKN